jgi:hypothetical protein
VHHVRAEVARPSDAYYRAGSFSGEAGSLLRVQCLEGLGETKSAVGLELLARVLREPQVFGPDQDRQLKYNEKIAAARGLANYNDYKATSALVEVLRKERDNIALINRAHESLVSATGRDLPADARAWEEFLANPAGSDAPTVSTTDRLLKTVGVR